MGFNWSDQRAEYIIWTAHKGPFVLWPAWPAITRQRGPRTMATPANAEVLVGVELRDTRGLICTPALGNMEVVQRLRCGI